MRREDLLKSIESEFLKDSDIKVADLQDTSKLIAPTFKTGTTTAGLICKDAVILGTDRRATMSYFVASKTAEKLHKIQDHLYMTIAGSVADAQFLVDILKAETSIYQLKREKLI